MHISHNQQNSVWFSLSFNRFALIYYRREFAYQVDHTILFLTIHIKKNEHV
jgi:hypothetical protein